MTHEHPPPAPPPPPYPYGHYPPQPPYNVYAILSLALGILVFPPLGIYFGAKAKQQIAASGERGIVLPTSRWLGRRLGADRPARRVLPSLVCPERHDVRHVGPVQRRHGRHRVLIGCSSSRGRLPIRPAAGHHNRRRAG